MKKLLAILVSIFLLPCIAQAGTYYVSANGAASWANCEEAAGTPGPKSGAAACPLATANSNAAAGDIVYFRGGTYDISVSAYAYAMAPTNSGSEGNPITYQAYSAGTWAERETPVIKNANGYGWPGYRIAIFFDAKSRWIVKGLTFEDWDIWAYVRNQSHYNEFAYNIFYNTATYYAAGGSAFGFFIFGSTTVGGSGSTHNWVHHNTFHSLAQKPCGEGGDIIRIGSYDAQDGDSDNNTIEDNLMYHAGHTLFDSFTHKNVIRNNVGYNDGFKTDITHVTGTATGGSTTTMVNTAVNFLTACDGGTCVGRSVHNLSQTNAYGPYTATIASLTTTTNPNDTVVFGTGTGTPTFANGHNYDISCRYFADTDPPDNSKYAHRCFHIDTIVRDGAQNNYNLFEGNRAGHSASNPNNNGVDGLSLSSDHCIVRYNAFVGNGGPGAYFKNSAAASYAKFYNNTLGWNGQHDVTYGDPVSPVVGVQIYFSSSLAANNALKNNLIFGNTAQFLKQSATPETAGNLCESADDWCAATTADPRFTNTTITTPANFATEPNLTLQSDSPAIDAGTYLTQANNAGTGSTALSVDDAGYFQDGTWGSSLSNIQADWICISASATNAGANCVQIASIDYVNNDITLAEAKTWSDNDYIFLFKKSDGTQVLYGDLPDAGAHEFESEESGEDTTAPTITAFTIPSVYRQRIVPVTLTCEDETALHAAPYCLTTTNDSGTCSWTASITTYTLSGEGAKTLYAFCRDAAATPNISSVGTQNVTLRLPGVAIYGGH